MPRRPDLPCARCGDLLWRGRGSLPEGQAVCHSCRRKQPQPCITCGVTFKPRRRDQRACSNECRQRTVTPGVCDGCGELTERGRSWNGRFCAECARARTQARGSRKRVVRRAAERFTDITTAFESQMRRRARQCPMCSVWMTDSPGLPSSKHLDHIIPIHVGGTHTIGNVRIICRTCNLSRPKDGSDLDGYQPTLWAQDAAVDELFAARRIKVCACGQPLRQGRCWTCEPARHRARPDEGKRAAELRAERMKWQDIADQLGFSSPAAALSSARSHGDPDVIARWPQRYERVA